VINIRPFNKTIQVLSCDWCGYETPFDGGYYNEICPKCHKGNNGR